MSFFTGELAEVEHGDYKTLNIYNTPTDSSLSDKLAEVWSFKFFSNFKTIYLFSFFCSINAH